MISPELIIFDMDGTLYKLSSKGDGAMFKTKFYTEVEKKGIDFISTRLGLSKTQAARIRQDIFKEYNGDVSIGLEEDFRLDRTEYFNEVWDINPAPYISKNKELPSLIERIVGKKAVLTAAPRVWAKNVLNYLEIGDLFNGMWFGEGDIRKPDPEAYLQITNAFNVNPRNTVMIEDEPTYLKPAKELGMTTILIGTNSCSWEDYLIEDIFGLEKIIRRK